MVEMRATNSWNACRT